MIRPYFALALQCALGATLLAACGGGGSGSADAVAPTATLTSPLNFADNLTGSLSLTATAGDNIGVASVEYQVDGRLVANTSTGPTYSMSVSTGNYAAGQHVVRARARDAAGNVSAWSSATVRFGGALAVAPGFTKTDVWVGSLTNATAMAQAPAPDGRWFVAEQGGAVRVIKAGVLLPTPFVQLTVDSSGERGLIGIALHPNFANNRFVYLHYTTAVGGTHNTVLRLTANSLNPDISGGGEFTVVDLPPLFAATNHNGGAIHFGADGKLFVGVGDNEFGANAQDPNSPLGKLLRLNDNGTVPSDNPFTARNGLAKYIWASGLRNPFTFAVQPGTGRIHINDVGELTWEEVNVGSAGANYGWPTSEGPDNIRPGVTAPLFAYNHSATAPPGNGPGGFFTGIAIAGGAFYPSTGPFPAELRGNYFFADLGSTVGVIDLANGNAAYSFARVSSSPVDLQVGADGAIYVLTRSAITKISAP